MQRGYFPFNDGCRLCPDTLKYTIAAGLLVFFAVAVLVLVLGSVPKGGGDSTTQLSSAAGPTSIMLARFQVRQSANRPPAHGQLFSADRPPAHRKLSTVTCHAHSAPQTDLLELVSPPDRHDLLQPLAVLAAVYR